MKCPFCKYEHGWNSKKRKEVKGNIGGFFRLEIELTKRLNYGSDYRILYACPVCGKAFIDV